MYRMCAAMIPAPVIFGQVFDMRCLVWRKTACGDGACQDYDALTLRFWLFGLALTYKALGVLCALSLIVFWPCIQRRKAERLRALLAARQNSRTSSRAHAGSSVQPNSDQPPPKGGHTHSASGPTEHVQPSEHQPQSAASVQQQAASVDKSLQGSAAANSSTDPSAPGFSGNLIELSSFKPQVSLAPGHIRSASDNTPLVGLISAASSPPALLASASRDEFGSSSQSKLFPASSTATSTSIAQSGRPGGLLPFADDSGVSSAHPSSLNSSNSNAPFAAHGSPANAKKAITRNSSSYGGGGVAGFFQSLGKRLRSQRPPDASSRRSHQLKRMHDVSERANGDASFSTNASPNVDGSLAVAIELPSSSPSGHQSLSNGALPSAAGNSQLLAPSLNQAQ